MRVERDVQIHHLNAVKICVLTSAVKISVLTQAINFFSLTRSNYLMPLTQGRGLGLATPLIIHNTANSVSFFLDKKCIYSVAERLYEHIRGVSDTCFNFTSAAGTSQTKCTVLAAHALQYTHKGAGVRIACIISYQSAKETTSMQCRDQLSHEVTKKVIKAAIKLCMHVICYI